MKRVYTAESLIDGQLVLDLLTHSGVPCLLFNQNAVGGFGDLPVTYPEVWVKRDRDLERAQQAVKDFENRATLTELTGLANEKKCRTCDEHNPSTFDICWQCSAVL